jgi:hypothetical protein
MKRRSFIEKSAKTALGAALLPNLFPTGRVFAATKNAKAKHIVVCMLGGIRNNESIFKEQGNLMPNLLTGNEVVSPSIFSSIPTLARLTESPLQQFGTLFNNVIYNEGHVSHFEAQAAILNGNYKGKPSDSIFNTLMETAKRTDFMLVSNPFNKTLDFADTDFRKISDLKREGSVYDTSADIQTVFEAEKILLEKKPGLLVISLNGTDIAHSNYSKYCAEINKVDFAMAHLWQSIQFNPALKDETVMIVLPEHGRNEKGNSITDINGKPGLDHGNNDYSRKSFCLVMGNNKVIKQNNVVKDGVETVDIKSFVLGLLDIKTGSTKESGFLQSLA